MRRIASFGLSLLLMFVFATPVLAATDVTVDKTVVTVGETFTLTAVTLKEKSEVEDFWSWSGDANTFTGVRVFSDTNYVNTLTFKAPSTPGTYTFTYTIHMYNTNANDKIVNEVTYGDSVSVLVEFTIVVEEKAAPAIAAELLNEAGVSFKYGSKGNYISDVAKLLENGARFMGVDKADVSAYRAAVKAYLVSRNALSE